MTAAPDRHPSTDYWPTSDTWQARPPAELGLDPAALDAAIAFHRAHETPWRPDFLTASGRYVGVADEPESMGGALGPVFPRGGPAGLILRGGVIAAEWGDTRRADMSFSIAKSYLAVLAGIAVARGLIRDIDDRVADYPGGEAYRDDQNRGITWRHLLQQTSEWQGTLFGKPDSIDHNRDVGRSDLGGATKGTRRAMRAPGTYWEYNDVRVNRLSLSLLQVFRRPLADVLRESVMDPIGATREWAWQPYDNAWVEIDGVPMPSVPGGSHWGGGLWMGTRDHARFGLLLHRRGQWRGDKLIEERWVDELRRPCAINPAYGLLWWLNTGRAAQPFAPESSWSARGAGSNVIWLDPEHDLVVVIRWIEKSSVAPFLERVLQAVRA